MRDLHILIEEETFHRLKRHYPDRGEISLLTRRLLELACLSLETGKGINPKAIADVVTADDKKRMVVRP